MNAVLDTNVLLRYFNPLDPAHMTVVTAVDQLQGGGWILHTVPQNHYELWVVATRPLANNGFGMTAAECDSMLSQVEQAFPLLADQAELLSVWRQLVINHDCKGKIAHDARLVAAMKSHGITHILTFNTKDFTRYSGITVLDPSTIASSRSP
ncbi:MAG: type II toxin-antitoxin system VapC family toxin [Fimbriiglobus sp.]